MTCLVSSILRRTLWINGYRSANGLNDRVPLPQANELDSSLRLIGIDRLELAVAQPGKDFGDFRRRVQGRFSYVWSGLLAPGY